MSRLGKTLVSVGSLLIVAVVGILIYCYWPAITGTVNNNKYYTQEDVQKAYDDGFSDGNKSETELNAKYEYYKTLVDDYYIQVTKLNEEITKLSSENASYSSQVKNLTTQKNNLQSQVDNLNTIKANNESLIETLNNEKQTLQNSLEEKISELNLTKEEVEQKENTIAELETTKANLQTEIENNKIEIEKLNQQIISLQNQIDALNETSEEYGQTILQLRDILDTDRYTIQRLNDSVEEKDAQIKELNTEITDCRNQINSLNRELSVKNAEIYKYQLQLENAQSTVTQLQQTNELNLQTITSLNSQVDSLNNQISEMSELTQTATTQINALNNRISELQESITYYENYLATLDNVESGDQVVATFEFNGSVYNIQIVKKDSKILVASPESTDHIIFNGWKVNNEMIDLNTYTISTNTKFIADLTYKFDVKFMVNETIYNSQIVVNNECATLPDNPTDETKQFLGWSLNGVDVIDDIATRPVTEHVTYVAIFQNLHMVTFIADNNIWTTQTIADGKKIAKAPTPVGVFDFKGWKLNNDVIDLDTYEVHSDITLIADISKYTFKEIGDAESVYSELIYLSTQNLFSYEGNLYEIHNPLLYSSIDEGKGTKQMSWTYYERGGFYSYEFHYVDILQFNTSVRLDFNNEMVWTDGNEIYYTPHNEYNFILNKEAKNWDAITFHNIPEYADARDIWFLDDKIYLSYEKTTLIFNKETKDWETTGLWTDFHPNFFEGKYIWSDGVNIYYSFNISQTSKKMQYVLNKETMEWIALDDDYWKGITYVYGSSVWEYEGKFFYTSDYLTYYVLDVENHEWRKCVWGSNLGKFYHEKLFELDNHIYYAANDIVYELVKE